MILNAAKGLMGIGSKISQFATGSTLGSMPAGLGLPMAYFGGQFLGEDIAKPLISGVQKMGTGSNELRAQTLMQMDMEMAARDQNERYERIQKETARHAASLAATSPHLYNQILAGRSLPQGAVVLGGTPRTDIMEQLAYGMASGQFNEQSSPEDDFLSTLGV